MKRITPFIVLFLLLALLITLEVAEQAGWKLEWKQIKEKVEKKRLDDRKNKPFIQNIHFGNDLNRPVKKRMTLMIDNEGKTIRHGESIRYTENGDVASRMNYINDIREGKCLIYHRNGTVWKEQVYVNGKLNGLCKRYDRYGKLSAEYEYKNGMPGTGLKEYTNLGKLREQPVLKIEKVDLMKSSNKYILKFSLQGKYVKRYKEVKYYMGDLAEDKYFQDNMVMAGKMTSNKTGELEFKVPKGYVLNERFTIVAVGKNSDGLTLILPKEVEVGVRGI